MAEIQPSHTPISGLWSSHKRIWNTQTFSTNIKKLRSFASSSNFSQFNMEHFLHMKYFTYGLHWIAPKEYFQCKQGIKITALQGYWCRKSAGINPAHTHPAFSSCFVKYGFLMDTFPLYFSNFDCRKQKLCPDKYVFCKSTLPGRTNH